MNKQRKLILAILAFVVIFSAAFGLSFIGRKKEPSVGNKVDLASLAQRDQQACASGPAYSRVKQVLFDDAAKIGNSDRKNLEALATHSVVRMEDPVFKGRDPASNAINCSGMFVLELPPGAERAFGGERRLAADIDYIARPAADGSGLVYEVTGAESILAQLADFDRNGQGYAPPAAPQVRLAEADTAPPPYSGPAVGGPFEPVDDGESATLPAPAPAPRASTDVERPQRQQSEDRSEARQRALAERRAKAREEAEKARVAQIRKQAEERRLAEAKAERAQKARAERRERSAEARAPRTNVRPSFNCRYARTRSERMVCDSGRLAQRDRQMASVFYSAMAEADRPTKRELNRTRDRFLAYRERCRTEECVAEAYEGRMREIDDIMTGR
jgi:hypothetical protein